MTNLEHYGFNNLEFKEWAFDEGEVVLEIYHKLNHSTEDIRLHCEIVPYTEDALKEAKVKWLMAEYVPFTCESTYSLNGYKMKHCKES